MAAMASIGGYELSRSTGCLDQSGYQQPNLIDLGATSGIMVSQDSDTASKDKDNRATVPAISNNSADRTRLPGSVGDDPGAGQANLKSERSQSWNEQLRLPAATEPVPAADPRESTEENKNNSTTTNQTSDGDRRSSRRGGVQFFRIKKQTREVSRMAGSVRKRGECTVAFANHNKERETASRAPMPKSITNVLETPDIGIIPPSPVSSECDGNFQKLRPVRPSSLDLDGEGSMNNDARDMTELLKMDKNVGGGSIGLGPGSTTNRTNSSSNYSNLQQILPYSTMNKGAEEDISDNAVSKIYEGCCYKLSSIIAIVVAMSVLFMVASKNENFHVCDNSSKYDFSAYSKSSADHGQGFTIEQYTRWVKKSSIYNIEQNRIPVTQLTCDEGKFLQFKVRGYYEPRTFYNKATGELIKSDAYHVSHFKFRFEFWPQDQDDGYLTAGMRSAELLCRQDKAHNNFQVILMNNSWKKMYILISETLGIEDVRCVRANSGNATGLSFGRN